MKLDIIAIIGLAITFGSAVAGLCVSLMKTAERFGKLEQRVAVDEDIIKDEKQKRRELSDRMITYNTTQATILATLDGMKNDIKEIKDALKK